LELGARIGILCEAVGLSVGARVGMHVAEEVCLKVSCRVGWFVVEEA